MSRIRLIIFSLLILIITGIPVAAQGTSITSIVVNRTNLTWLERFLDAAPDIRAKLNSGNYTLFAPTDDAFANLVRPLGIERSDLLLDPQLVTALLEYHIVAGSLSAQQIRERSGQVIATLLPGAFISFRVNGADQITLNNVVEIETANIRASNGVVHIINDVLLNRKITELVDNIDLSTFITPNVIATSTSTATEEPRATEISVQLANLRFAHFVADAESVDIYLNDELIFEAIEYGTVSDFIPIEAGNYDLSIKDHLAKNDGSLLDSVNIDIFEGDFTSLFLSGSLENDALSVAIIDEGLSALSSDTHLLFYYAVTDAPDADMTLGKDILQEALSVNDSRILNVSAGTYDLTVYARGDAKDIIFEQADIEFAAESYVLLALVGTKDEPQLISKVINSETVNQLLQEPTEQASATATVSNNETILDLLKNDEENRFSKFIEALEAANPTVINRLASRNLIDITVVAPTNDAFANLFTVVPESRFLGNRNLLSQVLQYHVVEGELLSSDFLAAGGTSIVTLLQPTQAFLVKVTSSNNVFLNGSVKIIEFDMQASNGVIQVVNNVLLPQVALNAWGL